LIVDVSENDVSRAWFDCSVNEDSAAVKNTCIAHAVSLDSHQVNVRGPKVQQLIQGKGGLVIVSGWAREATCSSSRDNLDELLGRLDGEGMEGVHRAPELYCLYIQ